MATELNEKKRQSYFTYQMPAVRSVMTKYVGLWNAVEQFENSSVHILILLDESEKKENIDKLMEDVKYKWPNSFVERRTVQEAVWGRKAWNENVMEKNKRSILIWHNYKGYAPNVKRDLLCIAVFKCIEFGFLPLCSLPRKTKEEPMFDHYARNFVWAHPFDCDFPNNYSDWWKTNSDEVESLMRTEGIIF